MTTEKTIIEYNEATSAQKLGDAIIRFGLGSGILKEGSDHLTVPQLLQVLDDAQSVFAYANELVNAAKAIGNGITVDVFWERQGYYFNYVDDLTKVSEEYPTLNACVRHLVLHGYTLRDVHRTRRSVPQPSPKLPERKPSDAE